MDEPCSYRCLLLLLLQEIDDLNGSTLQVVPISATGQLLVLTASSNATTILTDLDACMSVVQEINRVVLSADQ